MWSSKSGYNMLLNPDIRCQVLMSKKSEGHTNNLNDLFSNCLPEVNDFEGSMLKNTTYEKSHNFDKPILNSSTVVKESIATGQTDYPLNDKNFTTSEFMSCKTISREEIIVPNQIKREDSMSMIMLKQGIIEIPDIFGSICLNTTASHKEETPSTAKDNINNVLNIEQECVGKKLSGSNEMIGVAKLQEQLMQMNINNSSQNVSTYVTLCDETELPESNEKLVGSLTKCLNNLNLADQLGQNKYAAAKTPLHEKPYYRDKSTYICIKDASLSAVSVVKFQRKKCKASPYQLYRNRTFPVLFTDKEGMKK